ncbi:unnamed protein product [Rotaria socialis]|uniref:Uncharacterized protein n=2 Tax=Rotaria socialis TaxID=392032 RepID=A0A818V2F5_9BILA|nr:unnamed protein product [Rotaria socialis]
MLALVTLNKNNYHTSNKYDIHFNSSKAQLMSISGSNNQGSIFNDAQVNITNVFDQPIFLYLYSHSTLIYIVFITFLSIIMMILFLFFYHRYHRQKFYFNSLKKQSDHSCKSSNQANDIQNTLQTYIIYNEPKEHHPNNENKSLDEQDNQNLFTTTEVNTLVDIQSHRLSRDIELNYDTSSSFYQEIVDAMMQVNDNE